MEIQGPRVLCVGFCRSEVLFKFCHKEVRQVNIADLSKAIGKPASATERKQSKPGLQAATRLEAMHWPAIRRLVVKGATITQSGIQTALANHWGQVYAWKPIVEDKARKLLVPTQETWTPLFFFLLSAELDLPEVDCIATRTKATVLLDVMECLILRMKPCNHLLPLHCEILSLMRHTTTQRGTCKS